MRNGKKTGAAALLLCGVMVASAVGMGFAKWQTTVTAGGNVSAAGKWDVEMTDASVTLSSGAQLRENDADYGLQNVCAQKVYGQACIEAAVPRTKLTSFPATGTQNSRFTVSSWLWLVDTTRFDLSRLGTIGTEERRQLMLDGLADGSVIRLSDDQTAPDGTKISPFYVNDVPDFVVVVAVTVDGDFIFVRQYRHGTRQILLELPAGCMEPTDADPAAGAARELFEETGYAGSEPVFLCKVAPNAACISNFAHCYLITDCKRVSGQHLDATEDLEIVVMSAEETKKLMTNGGLVQAVHVAAMYYAEKLLNK